ncbi:MAG: DUF2490 domain-containing protein [Acidobacteriota bacterium]
MRSLLLVLLLVAGSSNWATAQTTVPESEFQVWNETVFSLPVLRTKDTKGKSVERLSLLLIGSVRLGQNRLVPVDKRIGGGFDLVLNKSFNFSPTYVYVAAQPRRGRHDFEHRIRFDLTYTKKFEHFSIKDRSRIEYRGRNSREDSVRYRNKFTFSYPVKRDGKELFAPFIADEPYYDFAAKHWSRNDLTPGISKKFSNGLSADFFYLWRHNRTGLPADVHAVGVNLKVKLK